MKKTIICVLLLVIAGCSATPTRRAFKEGWRDANITSKVKWKLGRDKLVKAHNLDIDTWRGVVTITGRAASEEEKAKAGAIAQNVKRVKDVRNLIDVVGTDSVPQKVARENIPFSKPAGKFAKPQEIALPTIDTNKKAAKTEGISETELAEETGVKEKVEINEETNLFDSINKDLAVTTEESISKGSAVEAETVDKDVTLQAEQELKELKARKKK